MHYYQFNIGDYQSHTAHLEPLEDLAYRRMLDWCYLHERPLPDDIEQISKLIRMRSHSDCIASVLREFFVCTPDGWWKERIGKEIEKMGEKSRKASESAKARWSKEKDDANALPAQSERNATHNTLPKTHNPLPKTQKAPAVLCPAGVEPKVWSDWMEIRKAKKLPLTETAWNQLMGECQKAGLTTDAMIKECCLRGWGAFKASWWAKESKDAAGGFKTQGDRNAEVIRGLTRGLLGSGNNVKLLGN